MTNSERAQYLSWKRKNVTYRGMRAVGRENGSMSAVLGEGLYSAALSNRRMAAGYGKVYFAVNAAPKNPKKFKELNSWEIFEQGLVDAYCREHGHEYDRRWFDGRTSVRDEVMKLGFDGVAVVGREMVNYAPDDSKIVYFEREDQVEDYWQREVAGGADGSRFDEYMANA